MMCFGASLGPIVWIYLSEIVPENGVALGAAASWVCTIVISLIFPLLAEHYIWVCFLFFSGCVALGFFYSIVKVKETKGKNKQ